MVRLLDQLEALFKHKVDIWVMNILLFLLSVDATRFPVLCGPGYRARAGTAATDVSRKSLSGTAKK